MYVPTLNRMDDLTQQLAFMRAHSFATLVSHVSDQLFATHVPLTVVDEPPTKATEPNSLARQVLVQGHLAKANPQWQELATQHEVLVIFQGPHAYISPRHYAKWESVPTWNYLAVHVYGSARLITDDAGKLAALAALINATEAGYQQQWEQQSPKFRNGLLQGIVAFEIAVTRIEGKQKLSQNRPTGDQVRVAAALAKQPDSAAQATARAMQSYQNGVAGGATTQTAVQAQETGVNDD